MFSFFKKKLKLQQSTQSDSQHREKQLPSYSPVVRYALYEAQIDQLPDGAVGVIIADAVDILEAMLTRHIFNVPVIVYRTGNCYEFYNHELVSCGSIQILKHDGENFDIEVHGEELQPHDQGVFHTTKFMNVLAYDYAEMDRLLKEKFPDKPILGCSEG